MVLYFFSQMQTQKGVCTAWVSQLWNSEGMGERVMHFGISEGKGGLKHGSRPWLGMDIFWNCPINSFGVVIMT